MDRESDTDDCRRLSRSTLRLELSLSGKDEGPEIILPEMHSGIDLD